MIDIERAELIHIEELIIRGEYHDALDLLESVKKMDEKLTDEEKHTSELLLGKVLIKLGKPKKSITIAKKVFKVAEKNKDIILSLEALNVINTAYDTLDNLKQEIKWLEKGEKYFSQLESQGRGELKPLLAEYQMLMGRYFYKIGDFDEGWNQLSDALTFVEEFEYNTVKADVLDSISSYYILRGKMDLALEAKHQSLTIWEVIENQFMAAQVKNDLAYIMAIQGDIHLALEKFLEGLEIVNKSSNRYLIGKYKLNIGLVHLEMDELDLAIDWFKQCYKKIKTSGNKRRIVETLFYLVFANVKMNQIEEAEKYRNEMAKKTKRTKDQKIKQWLILSEAIVLANSSRLYKIGKAEELFISILKEVELSQRITITTLLHLSKLQLKYLMKTMDEEMYEDLKSNLERLEEIANQQDSYILFSETYILQAQASIIDEDYQKAQDLLMQARSLAQVKELERIGEEVSNLFNVLVTKLEVWEKLYDYNSSLIELLEQTPYENGLKKIARERVSQVSLDKGEDPILILIQDEGGTSMYSRKFLPNSEFDEQLISAFLFAINKFMQETFAGKGTIEKITYLDYTLLFNPIDPLLICYAYRGQSYTAEQNIDRFTDRIKNTNHLWNGLINYTETGYVPNIEHLLEIEEIVDEIFSTKISDFTNILDDDIVPGDLEELRKLKL